MLPRVFLDRPIAHRGLHDLDAGRAENSTKAFAAAIAHDYAIELDLQLSKDGQAIVFHDYDLRRLTGETGPVALRTAAELRQMSLTGDGDPIPTLDETLEQVAGRVPLLIELKDQDGAMGPNVGALEDATVQALARYDGPVAVMSFNPHSVAALLELAPDLPRGLVTCAYDADDWPTVPKARREELALIPDMERVKASFVSHDKSDLHNPRLSEIADAGFPILCWTIRSAKQEAEARKIVQNITFEKYLA